MYSCHALPFDETQQFSSLFNDYINKKKELFPFYNLYPETENFGQVISNKKFSNENREVLHQSLSLQYKNTDKSSIVESNIKAILNEQTFTVTTGHQLCLFTGPLYFIYKIITTINLVRILKEKHPDKHFVPVYWMASEDHDFEEINHFYLFNRKHEWQTTQKGAVGKFQLEEVKNIFEGINEKLPLLEQAYFEQKDLADATRFLVNELFGEYGLIVLDGDDKNLKSLFKNHIKADIFENTAFHTVTKTSNELQKLHYPAQIHSREINFFYLGEGLRERIVFENGIYKVLNTAIEFDQEKLIQLIENEPEKFSPNVVLRPLYQETILPNLAYIGGPGELAYWLQLKDFFTASAIEFPLLVPRNFGLIVNKPNAEKLKKLKMKAEDLFLKEHELKQIYLERNNSILFDSNKYADAINQLYTGLKTEALATDKSLDGFVDAQRVENLRIIDNISKKLKKAAEQKENEGISQLINIQNKLFPEGGLQERRDNFLNFYLNTPDFIATLLQIFGPLDFRFNILVESEA